MTLVLGIESSCDETGVGLVRDGVLVGHAVASSVEEHARFGGVVPEIAARAHAEALRATVQRALDDAGATLDDVDVVAATAGPGLMSALLVGLSAAKAYALALDVPFYAIHHLAAHVAVATLDGGPLPTPSVALVVSGGHTSILVVDDLARAPVVHLGDTLDDAAGEAFDKVARLLGLPFPGGPNVDRAATQGDPEAIRFPRGLSGPQDAPFAFSFSGLKTAVARHVESLDTVPVPDVAASFQESVADVLSAKAVRACRDRGIDTLVAIGGVVANSRLRALLQERCDEAGITLRVPPVRLCTDNGAMVAALGWLLVQAQATPSDLSVGAQASVALQHALLD